MAADPHVLDRSGLAALRDVLARTRRVLGPIVRNGAVVHDELRSLDDLPSGVESRQAPGSYRLVEGGTSTFGPSVGPQSWKPHVFPPRSQLFTTHRRDGQLVFEPSGVDAPPLALFGVRSCDVHALEVLDRVFLEGADPDVEYESRRESTFVVAVTCGAPGGTCFCASMGTGPRPTSGYDIALTEIAPGRFLAEAGTEEAAELLGELPSTAARDADLAAAARVVEVATALMGRTLDPVDLPELLVDARKAQQWQQVGDRCLSCTNCTLVCPTCFCHAVEDASSLDGTTTERWRLWDSCFALSHSTMHGGPVRELTAARYRQWLTHKLGSWHDQFGVSGCVGCGRCITWCPVGIDITAEVEALRGELDS